MFKFTLTVTFPALDRLVDFLNTHFNDQSKVDELTAQIVEIRTELSTSSNSLATTLSQQK